MDESMRLSFPFGNQTNQNCKEKKMSVFLLASRHALSAIMRGDKQFLALKKENKIWGDKLNENWPSEKIPGNFSFHYFSSASFPAWRTVVGRLPAFLLGSLFISLSSSFILFSSYHRIL